MLLRPHQELKVAIEQYYIELVQYAMGFVIDEDMAREVVNKVYKKIFQRGDELYNARRGASPRTFLYNCTRNACIDHLRSPKDPSQTGGEELDMTIADDAPPVDEKLYALQVISRIHQFMKNQKPRLQTMFIKLYVEGMNATEAGKALGIPTATAYRYETRLNALLKKEFGDWDRPNLLVLLPLVWLLLDG